MAEVGITLASLARRDSPAPNCCGSQHSTPVRPAGRHRRFDGRQSSCGPVSVARGGIPDLVFCRSTATAVAASTSCSSACRTRHRWNWRRRWSGTVGCVVDSVRRLPTQGPGRVPDVLRLRAHPARPARAGGVRPARAASVRPARGRPRRHARLSRDDRGDTGTVAR